LNDVEVRVGFDLVLVFKGTRGANDKTVFTLNASQTDEFQVKVDATIPSTSDHPMIGSIGFLPVTAADRMTPDHTAPPTSLPRHLRRGYGEQRRPVEPAPERSGGDSTPVDLGHLGIDHAYLAAHRHRPRHDPDL